MESTDVGVGDRAALGVRADQRDLAARRGLEGELVEAFSQLVCDKRRPRPKPGAVTALEGPVKTVGRR
jgi:hypothetical protein